MGIWISTWTADPTVPADPALPVLLCLPPAGAGCQQFRAWQPALEGTAQVYGVQLPGRENRWREPMPDTFDEAVEAITAELVSTVGKRPLIVFGHSFGGLLGYEVSRRVTPRALVVSGCRAPGHWTRPAAASSTTARNSTSSSTPPTSTPACSTRTPGP